MKVQFEPISIFQLSVAKIRGKSKTECKMTAVS